MTNFTFQLNTEGVGGKRGGRGDTKKDRHPFLSRFLKVVLSRRTVLCADRMLYFARNGLQAKRKRKVAKEKETGVTIGTYKNHY